MKIYLVGGAVRDQLLGFPYHEKDWVVVGGDPEDMLAQGYTPVGKDFPVFLHPKTHEEYALARTERKTGVGYKGFSFHTDKSVSLEQDLARRDLTINAMAQDDDGQIIDPYRGQDDLKQRYLRHISPAFKEDPVRVLRVARFAARYHHLGFRIADETLALMQAMVENGETDHLVRERIWQECYKALNEKNPEIFFKALQDCDALGSIFPALEAYADNCIAALTLANHSSSALIRFSAFCLPLDTPRISELCQNLNASNDFKALATLANEYQKMRSSQHWNQQSLAEFFQKTDALRKTQRFEQILEVWQALDQEDHQANNNKALLEALSHYSEVDPQALIEQGFEKAELGRAIQQTRLDRLDQWLATKNLG